MRKFFKNVRKKCPKYSKPVSFLDKKNRAKIRNVKRDLVAMQQDVLLYNWAFFNKTSLQWHRNLWLRFSSKHWVLGHLAGVETEKLRKIKKETETETADCLFSTAEMKLPFPLSLASKKELKNLKIWIVWRSFYNSKVNGRKSLRILRQQSYSVFWTKNFRSDQE